MSDCCDFLAANRRNWDERVAIHRRDRTGFYAIDRLRLEFLHEHAGLPWPPFPMCVRGEDGLWHLPDRVPALPLSLSLRARKAAG